MPHQMTRCARCGHRQPLTRMDMQFDIRDERSVDFVFICGGGCGARRPLRKFGEAVLRWLVS